MGSRQFKGQPLCEVEYAADVDEATLVLAYDGDKGKTFQPFGKSADSLPIRQYETAGWMRVIREDAVQARYIRIKGGGCLSEIEVYSDLPPVAPRGLYRFEGWVTPLWYETDQAVDSAGFAIDDAKIAEKDIAPFQTRLADLQRTFRQAMESVTGRTTAKEYLALQDSIIEKAKALETDASAFACATPRPMLDPRHIVENGFIRMHAPLWAPCPVQAAASYARRGSANMIKSEVMRDVNLDVPLSKEKAEGIQALKYLSLREGLPFFVMFWYTDKRTLAYPWGSGRGVPGHLEGYKREMDFDLQTFGDHPGFAGIYFDEMFGAVSDNEYLLAAFRNRLRQYSPEALKEHGVEDVEKVVIPSIPKSLKLSEKEFAAFSPREKFIWIECLEAEGDLFHGEMDEVCRYVRAKRPGTKMYVLLTPASMWGDPIGGASFARMGRIADIMGVDLYSHGFYDKAFICALIASTATAKTVFTPGAHYGNSLEGFNHDLVLAMAHNDGVWPFSFGTVFKQHNYTSRAPEGLWEDTCRIYSKMARLEPYLANTTLDTPIGLVYSERTAAMTHWGMGFKGSVSHYITGNEALYQALAQSHVSAEPFFIQLATPEFLKKYKVLVMQDARSLTDEEMKALSDWVQRGGVLIATASSSMKDRWGIVRGDYGLAKLFGVRFVKTGVSHRSLTVNQVSAVLPGIDPGCPLDLAGRAADLVKTAGGQVLAAWEDGSPAIVSNSYGKGQTVFISACLPFKPGQKDSAVLLESCVSGALKRAGATMPFELTGASGNVYAVVRRQGERRILHMINLGSDACADVKVRVLSPAARQATLQPEGVAISIRRVGDYAEFDVPSFNLHSAIVLE
ncbi:MAG: beta-galactosidase trimerization domain-containing protein [Kiritimatiellae bacterium]|nr:beta-galactosidase trimerization domain-containing protein [Kiritimatiellia bacterium]